MRRHAGAIHQVRHNLTGRCSTPLLVLHRQPDALARWVEPAALQTMLLLKPQAPSSKPASHDDQRLDHPTGLERDPRVAQLTFRLPIDGPCASIERALTGLRARLPEGCEPWIVPRTIRGCPPSRPLLDLIRGAGFRAGVDLSTVRWVGEDGILWADGDDVTAVRVRADQPAEAMRASSIVKALRGFDPTTPGGIWVSEGSVGPRRASAASWALVLAAHYLEVVARRQALHLVATAG